MAFSGSQITRLGLAAITRALYGAFTGKTAAGLSASGSPQAENATTSATAVRVVTGSGVPQAENATATGAASRIQTHTASGTPQAEDATASGIATGPSVEQEGGGGSPHRKRKKRKIRHTDILGEEERLRAIEFLEQDLGLRPKPTPEEPPEAPLEPPKQPVAAEPVAEVEEARALQGKGLIGTSESVPKPPQPERTIAPEPVMAASVEAEPVAADLDILKRQDEELLLIYSVMKRKRKFRNAA